MTKSKRPVPTCSIDPRVTAHTTVCPDCKGDVRDASSRLAMGMGIVTLRCNGCARSWGIKVSRGPTSYPVW